MFFVVFGLFLGGLPAVFGCLGLLLGCDSCCGGGSGSYSYSPYPYSASYPYASYPAYPRAHYYPPSPAYSPSYVPVYPTPYVVPPRPSYYPRVAPLPYSPATYLPPPSRQGYVQPSYSPLQVQVSPAMTSPLLPSTSNPSPFPSPRAPDSTGNYIANLQPLLVEATTAKHNAEASELQTSVNNSYGDKTSPSSNHVSNTEAQRPHIVSQEVTNTVTAEHEPVLEEPLEIDYTPDDDSSRFPLVGVVTQTPEVPGQHTTAPPAEPFFPPVTLPSYLPEAVPAQETSMPPPVEDLEYAETEQEETPAALSENGPEADEPEVTVDGGVGDDENSIGYGRRRKSVRAN